MTSNRAAKKAAREAKKALAEAKYTDARRSTRHDEPNDPAHAAARRNAKIAALLAPRVRTDLEWADVVIDARRPYEFTGLFPLEDFSAAWAVGTAGARVHDEAGVEQIVSWSDMSALPNPTNIEPAPGAEATGSHTRSDTADDSGAAHPALIEVAALGSIDAYQNHTKRGVAVRLTYTDDFRIGYVSPPIGDYGTTPDLLWNAYLTSHSDVFHTLFHVREHVAKHAEGVPLEHPAPPFSAYDDEPCEDLPDGRLAAFRAAQGARNLRSIIDAVRADDYSWFDLPGPIPRPVDERQAADFGDTTTACDWLTTMWTTGSYGFTRHSHATEILPWIGYEAGLASAAAAGFDMSNEHDRARLTTLVPFTWAPRPGPSVDLTISPWYQHRPTGSHHSVGDRLRRLAKHPSLATVPMAQAIGMLVSPGVTRAHIDGAWTTAVVIQDQQSWGFALLPHSGTFDGDQPSRGDLDREGPYLDVHWDQASPAQRQYLLSSGEWVQAPTLTQLLVALLRAYDANNHDGICVTNQPTMLGWTRNYVMVWQALMSLPVTTITTEDTPGSNHAQGTGEPTATIGDLLTGAASPTDLGQAELLGTLHVTSRDDLAHTTQHLAQEYRQLAQSCVFDWAFHAAGHYLNTHEKPLATWQHAQDLAFHLSHLQYDFRPLGYDPDTAPLVTMAQVHDATNALLAVSDIHGITAAEDAERNMLTP